MRLLVRYIKGYYQLFLSGGNAERFFNICKNNGVEFSDIKCKDGKYICRIRPRQYEDIIKFGKKTGVLITVEKRAGIKFFFERYRKRKIFALCMLLFAVSMYISTLYVWNIRVSCDGVYTEVQIKKYVEENYALIGTRTKDIDCELIEKDLRQTFTEIAWVSCALEGTTLNIVFTETIFKETVENCDKPCNIVAVKDAVVTQNIINKGVVVARKGAEVKKGDILITGVINVLNDYDELIETNYVCAKGYVYGLVYYEYEDSFSLEEYEKLYTGSENKSYTLMWLDNFIKLPKLKDSKYELCDTIGDTKQLSVFGYKNLPLGVYVETKREYILERVALSESEAREKAEKRLLVYIEELRKKGVEILENNVKIDIEDGVLTAKGTIKCEELIGVPSEINILNQGDIP